MRRLVAVAALAVLGVMAVTAEAASRGQVSARPRLEAGDPEGPQFLTVSYRVRSQDRISYTWVYETHAAARVDALRMAACGFWRTDLVTRESFLVLPRAIEEIAFTTPQETPPFGAPELPAPDIFAIVQCQAGLRAR